MLNLVVRRETARL